MLLVRMLKGLALLVASTLPALAYLVPVQLILDPSSIDVTLRVGGLADVDTTQISGTVEALIDIDLATNEVSELRFYEGEIAASDLTFIYGFYPAFGQRVRTLSVQGVPLDRVAPVVNGEVDAAQFLLNMNDGQLSTDGSLAADGTSELSEEPLVFPGSGTGTVAVVRNGDGSYSITTQLPIQGTQMVDVDGTEVEAIYNGTLNASGSFTIEASGFVAWANTVNQIPIFDRDSNGDGYDEGVAFALGLEGGETPDDIFDGRQFLFTKAGSRLPIVLQRRPSLTSGDWENVPASEVSGGNPIPANTEGQVTVEEPEEGIVFYRLLVDEE